MEWERTNEQHAREYKVTGVPELQDTSSTRRMVIQPRKVILRQVPGTGQVRSATIEGRQVRRDGMLAGSKLIIASHRDRDCVPPAWLEKLLVAEDLVWVADRKPDGILNRLDVQEPPADYDSLIRSAVLEAEEGAADDPTDAKRFYAMGLRMAAALYGLPEGNDPYTRQQLSARRDEPILTRSAQQVDALCALARSFVDGGGSDPAPDGERAYARGVLDTVRWQLGYPRRDEQLGTVPVTGAQIVALMDQEAASARVADAEVQSITCTWPTGKGSSE
jgi:hypothetical protein